MDGSASTQTGRAKIRSIRQKHLAPEARSMNIQLAFHFNMISAAHLYRVTSALIACHVQRCPPRSALDIDGATMVEKHLRKGAKHISGALPPSHRGSYLRNQAGLSCLDKAVLAQQRSHVQRRKPVWSTVAVDVRTKRAVQHQDLQGVPGKLYSQEKWLRKLSKIAFVSPEHTRCGPP